jgi:hypothetical protein
MIHATIDCNYAERLLPFRLLVDCKGKPCPHRFDVVEKVENSKMRKIPPDGVLSYLGKSMPR